MQFIKKTSSSKNFNFFKLLIKFSLVFVIIFVIILLLNQIDFPSPNKEIEKRFPNENLKIVK